MFILAIHFTPLLDVHEEWLRKHEGVTEKTWNHKVESQLHRDSHDKLGSECKDAKQPMLGDIYHFIRLWRHMPTFNKGKCFTKN